ncbi:MAG: 16S rRNA methyltransferase [Candidatus Hadarchaeales archaeon]
MLHLIIADSEIELVPKEISHHRVILWQARKRGMKPTDILLNSGVHHPAMKSLKEWERRGRPDIVHMCLLIALDSPLNAEGHLRVYVHTRENNTIFVEPSTNLPRTLNRFEGLLEQLFQKKAVPPEKPLLTIQKLTLEELCRRISPKKIIALSENGEKGAISRLFSGLALADDTCLIIGGFPHGNFISDLSFADEVVSIYPKALMASTVVAEVISSYERSFGVIE